MQIVKITLFCYTDPTNIQTTRHHPRIQETQYHDEKGYLGDKYPSTRDTWLAPGSEGSANPGFVVEGIPIRAHSKHQGRAGRAHAPLTGHPATRPPGHQTFCHIRGRASTSRRPRAMLVTEAVRPIPLLSHPIRKHRTSIKTQPLTKPPNLGRRSGDHDAGKRTKVPISAVPNRRDVIIASSHYRITPASSLLQPKITNRTPPPPAKAGRLGLERGKEGQPATIDKSETRHRRSGGGPSPDNVARLAIRGTLSPR